jgi:uncharacterized protein
MSKKSKIWWVLGAFAVILFWLSPEEEQKPPSYGTYTSNLPTPQPGEQRSSDGRQEVKSYTPPPSEMYAGDAAIRLIQSGAIPGVSFPDDVFEPVVPNPIDQGIGSPATFQTTTIRFKTQRGVLPMIAGIANTPELRERGLMFFQKWPKEMHGVLFLFERSESIAMWMKNTYIPLDILFMDTEGKVVHIAYQTTPLSEATISSQYPARAVLEIPAGAAKRWQLNVGDVLIYGDYGKEIK